MPKSSRKDGHRAAGRAGGNCSCGECPAEMPALNSMQGDSSREDPEDWVSRLLELDADLPLPLDDLVGFNSNTYGLSYCTLGTVLTIEGGLAARN